MSRQRGSSLVVALFVIVVVALLAVFAVRVGGSERQSGSLSLLSSRALSAARTGIAWGAYRARFAASCQNTPAQTLLLSEGALRGFQVTVDCHTYPHQGAAFHSYEITATAQYGTYGTVDFASRTLTARYFTLGY